MVMGLNVSSINSNRPSAKVYPPISKVSRVTKGATPIQEVDGPLPSSGLDETLLNSANAATGDTAASVLFEGKGSEVDVYV
jgi:hypothetical protein